MRIRCFKAGHIDKIMEWSVESGPRIVRSVRAYFKLSFSRLHAVLRLRSTILVPILTHFVSIDGRWRQDSHAYIDPGECQTDSVRKVLLEISIGFR